MNEKYYNGNYTSYQHSLKQVTTDQMCYSYSNFSVNALSPITHFSDICNISSQNFNFQQSNSIHQEQSDAFMFEGKILSDAERYDKIDMIDVSSKELSPASFCSNTDLIVSNSYKHNTNKYDNEWCYSQNSCSQKGSSYTSCSQGKVNKYCGVQKSHYMPRNCNYSDVYHENNSVFSNFNDKNLQNEPVWEYTYNYYENKCMGNQSFIQNDNYISTNTNVPFSPIINPIDQQTEGSNEESDIIVEESDEEITDDCSEDQEKRTVDPANRCLICNVMYTPLGTQFYFLTAETPLTMSTQKPVAEKLVNIIGQVSTTRNYLCSECLGFINHIDHLQRKLEIFKSDIITKFKRTCLQNNIECGKKFSEQKIKHNKMPRFKCKLCRKILCLKTYCLYHLKRHKNQGYLCELCGRIYSNKRKFALHSFQHKCKKQSKIEGFNCRNCNKIFRTKSNQKEHENYCLSLLPFKCPHERCDKKFPSASKLKNHVRLKHDKKFIVICSICNIGFIKISDYKTHMISHSADKKYSCSKCDKSYKTLSNLNFHMKVHATNLPFNCHICKKGFTRKDYLETHINNHNGVKNFSCTFCEKKFVSQKNLDAHLKYHEGTVKKKTCNICGKTMTTGFEEHLRIHNNLKEFECEHCDMKFNTKGTLSKHVKKKHLTA